LCKTGLGFRRRFEGRTCAQIFAVRDANLGQPTNLDLANSLAGQVQDGADLFQGDPATVGDIVPGVVRVETSEGQLAFAVSSN